MSGGRRISPNFHFRRTPYTAPTRTCTRCGDTKAYPRDFRVDTRTCRACDAQRKRDARSPERSAQRAMRLEPPSADTPRRLYLTHHDRYRVRYLNGQTVVASWDDTAMVFRTGRGADRRVLDLDRIAACAPFAQDGRCAVSWTPWGDCYRARWRPADKTPTWVHPYRRLAPEASPAFSPMRRSA